MLLIANKPTGALLGVLNQGEFASVVIPPGENAECSNGAVLVTWSQPVDDLNGITTSRHWISRTDLNCVKNASSGALPTPACDAAPSSYFHVFPLVYNSSAQLPNDAPWVEPIRIASSPTTVNLDGRDACDVLDGTGHIDPTKLKTVPRYAVEASGDVQIVRLPGGVLIQAGLGEKRQFRLFADPKWAGLEGRGPYRYAQVTCAEPLFHSNAVLIRRSDDCGKTWNLISAVEVNDFSWADWGGAHALDRIELKYDDVNGRLLLTGMAQDQWGGKSPISFPLWISEDQGQTWTLAGDLAEPYGTPHRWVPGNPVVHTPSSNGRLYAFSCVGNTPTLMWTDDMLRTPVRRWTVNTAAGYPACDFLGGANIFDSNGHEIRRETTRGGFHQVLPTPSIAVSKMAETTDGEDYVWIVFPGVKEVASELPGGDVDITHRQVAHVLRIRVDRRENGSGTMGAIGSREPVRVVNWFPIKAGLGDDVVFPTLISPDRFGRVAPHDPARGTVLLSWLETEGDALFHQKARAFSETERGKLVELTVKNKAADPWPSTRFGCGPARWKDDAGVWHDWIGPDGQPKRDCWYGDYQYGSFVEKLPNGNLQFLRVWGESDPTLHSSNIETHANFVEVSGTWN